MLTKISIKDIILDHLSTIKNDNSKKMEFKDVFVFFIIPLIFPALMLYTKSYLKTGIIDTLITIFSIFVGLLLNVLVVIFDIIQKGKSIIMKRLIKETFSNISFTILLSIFTILTLIICRLADKSECELTVAWECTRIVSNAISYYFLILFLLTLLMIVRRIHIILSDEMNNHSGSS